MVCAAWLLLACDAADLRIDVPPKGIDALSITDIKRDIWLSEHSEGDHSWYVQRMEQMGLTLFSVQAGICVGKKESPRISVLETKEKSIHLQKAVQISLAKIQHQVQGQEFGFCVYTESIPMTDWVLGDMSGLILRMEEKNIYTEQHPRDIPYASVIIHVKTIARKLNLLSGDP